jgi:transcriptional regulator
MKKKQKIMSEVQEAILCLRKKGLTSQEIVKEFKLSRQQVAAVIAWNTMRTAA